MDKRQKKSDIALIGLGSMGSRLSVNIAEKGYRLAIYDINPEKTKELLKRYSGTNRISAAYSIKDLMDLLKKPKKIIFMITAGRPVDSLINELVPYLDGGDILLDGGNSYFKDTEKRQESLKAEKIQLIGAGFSGGKKGALKGPAIMPGGDKEAYEEFSDILKDIAAKASDGRPCVSYKGNAGAGHYIKMVHNGIEYADMQLIGECFWNLKLFFRGDLTKTSQVFESWNKDGDMLKSYLIKISADILKNRKDPTKDQLLIEDIADYTQMKGTGTWTIISALEQLVPIPTIASAVFSREISEMKDLRKHFARKFEAKKFFDGNIQKHDDLTKIAHDALLVAKIASYAQGFSLLQDASKRYKYCFNIPGIALDWRAGCIIRADFLSDIAESLKEDPTQNLAFSETFMEIISNKLKCLERFINISNTSGIPVPCMSSSFNYILQLSRDILYSSRLTAAQRDLFGSHGYFKLSNKEGAIIKDKDGNNKKFYTEWETTEE